MRRPVQKPHRHKFFKDSAARAHYYAPAAALGQTKADKPAARRLLKRNAPLMSRRFFSFNRLVRFRRVASHANLPKGHERGVTLIEMMIVLVIIGIVAAMIVPTIIGRPDEARVTVAKADLEAIAGALELYRLDNQTYPTTEQGLLALAEKPTISPVPLRWNPDGYLRSVPIDPWGQPYIYRGQGRSFQLYSHGADGQPGGEGPDADIAAKASRP
jgi:general secretion pathway protein G